MKQMFESRKKKSIRKNEEKEATEQARQLRRAQEVQRGQLGEETELQKSVRRHAAPLAILAMVKPLTRGVADRGSRGSLLIVCNFWQPYTVPVEPVWIL